MGGVNVETLKVLGTLKNCGDDSRFNWQECIHGVKRSMEG